MQTKKIFLAKAVVFSLLAILLFIYTMPLSYESEFLIFKLLFLVMLIGGSLLFWNIVIFYGAFDKMRSEFISKYENLERALLDIRDGTKYFYSEKRRSLRIKTDLSGRFPDKADEFLKIGDLGYRGALLKTTRPLKTGDTVKLEISLPFFSKPIFAKGRVARVNPTKETKGGLTVYDAGVEYTNLSDEDNEKLTETVTILGRAPRKK